MHLAGPQFWCHSSPATGQAIMEASAWKHLRPLLSLTLNWHTGPLSLKTLAVPAFTSSFLDDREASQLSPASSVAPVSVPTQWFERFC